MIQYQIAVVVGSLRRDSLNRKLANAIVKLAPSEFKFTQLQIGDLPLYNQDDDATPHETVVRLKADITQAQGLFFSRRSTTARCLACSKTQLTTPHGLTAKAHGLGSRRACLVRRLVPLARPWRSNICATCWRISMCRRWASLRRLFTQRMVCLTVSETSVKPACLSCKPGWIITSRGSKNLRLCVPNWLTIAQKSFAARQCFLVAVR